MLWRGELAAELERDLLGPATLVHARGGCAAGRRDSAAVRLAGERAETASAGATTDSRSQHERSVKPQAEPMWARSSGTAQNRPRHAVTTFSTGFKGAPPARRA
jgi:hypothetical protein